MSEPCSRDARAGRVADPEPAREDERLNASAGRAARGDGRVTADDEVKVVVVTGAGERAFSAGFDLEADAASLGTGRRRVAPQLAYDVDVTMRLWSLPKPTIAQSGATASPAGARSRWRAT